MMAEKCDCMKKRQCLSFCSFFCVAAVDFVAAHQHFAFFSQRKKIR